MQLANQLVSQKVLHHLENFKKSREKLKKGEEPDSKGTKGHLSVRYDNLECWFCTRDRHSIAIILAVNYIYAEHNYLYLSYSVFPLMFDIPGKSSCWEKWARHANTKGAGRKTCKCSDHRVIFFLEKRLLIRIIYIKLSNKFVYSFLFCFICLIALWTAVRELLKPWILR